MKKVLPAALHHVDEGEFLGGVDGEGSDGKGGGRRSRKATAPPSVLPQLHGKQVSHRQSGRLVFRHQTTSSVLTNEKSVAAVRNVQATSFVPHEKVLQSVWRRTV